MVPRAPKTRFGRSLSLLAAGFSLSIVGILVGGTTGTLLVAVSGNLLTVVAVYLAAGRRRNGA